MKELKDIFPPQYKKRLYALNEWHRALENKQLRMDCPDVYHEELIRQSDEMDRLHLIDWTEWRDLRCEADQAYLRAVAGYDYQSGAIEGAKELI